MNNQNLSLGFIGTGGITEAFVTGLVRSVNKTTLTPFNQIQISQRSSHRSTRLAATFDCVNVCTSNQEIVDQSDWLFLAVLPEQAENVLAEITIPGEKCLISLVAGISVEQLQAITGIDKVHRIIPLPPVEFGLGPIPIYPGCQKIEELLNIIGTAIPIVDEGQFSSFSAASAVMATYFEFSAAVAAWLRSQGLPQESSVAYTTTMLQALATTTVDKNFSQHNAMSEECLTPGGLNESILFQKRESGWFDSIKENLDRIYARITG